MARLVLTLSSPLSLSAAAALPEGCAVENGPAGATVRAELRDEDLVGLVAMTAALARALPEAQIRLEGVPVAGAEARPVTERTEAAAGAGADAWDLVEAGRAEEALVVLAGKALDSAGRDRVRELVQSGDPAQVVLACRIAAATDWRSFVTTMRALLGHAEAPVRAAAVRAIGALAGPSMTWQLLKLGQVADAQVRAAVIEAVAAIEGRQV